MEAHLIEQRHFDGEKKDYAHQRWNYNENSANSCLRPLTREDEVKKHFVGAMLLTWVDKKSLILACSHTYTHQRLYKQNI